jgi:tRNA(adenine34) deaminase
MEIKYMHLALKQAKLAATKDEVPVGCVIVSKGKVLAKAHNQKEKFKSAVYHAEMVAILKAVKKVKDWRLDDADLYVTLEPCLMCLGAIVNHRIKNIYFGAYDPKGGAIESSLNLSQIKGLNHYPKFKGGVLQEESAATLKSYFKTKRNKQ